MDLLLTHISNFHISSGRTLHYYTFHSRLKTELFKLYPIPILLLPHDPSAIPTDCNRSPALSPRLDLPDFTRKHLPTLRKPRREAFIGVTTLFQLTFQSLNVRHVTTIIMLISCSFNWSFLLLSVSLHVCFSLPFCLYICLCLCLSVR